MISFWPPFLSTFTKNGLQLRILLLSLEMTLYLLQPRRVSLKDLKAVPLTCHHQEGRGLCLPVSVGGRILASRTASEQTLIAHTGQPFTNVLLPWLCVRPYSLPASLTPPFSLSDAQAPVCKLQTEMEFSSFSCRHIVTEKKKICFPWL